MYINDLNNPSAYRSGGMGPRWVPGHRWPHRLLWVRFSPYGPLTCFTGSHMCIYDVSILWYGPRPLGESHYPSSPPASSPYLHLLPLRFHSFLLPTKHTQNVYIPFFDVFKPLHIYQSCYLISSSIPAPSPFFSLFRVILTHPLHFQLSTKLYMTHILFILHSHLSSSPI